MVHRSALLRDGSSGVLLFWGLRRSINSTTDRELQGKLVSVTEMMRSAMPNLPTTELQDEFGEQSPPGGDLIHVRTAEGDSIFQSPALKQFSPDLISMNSTQPGFHDVASAGRAFRVLTEKVNFGDRMYVVQVIADVSEFTELLRKFHMAGFVFDPTDNASGVRWGYWLSNRALSPVSEIIQKARSINATNLSSRLDLPDNKDELHELSATLNEMLDRIELSFTKVQTIQF